MKVLYVIYLMHVSHQGNNAIYGNIVKSQSSILCDCKYYEDYKGHAAVQVMEVMNNMRDMRFVQEMQFYCWYNTNLSLLQVVLIL